LLSQYPKSRLEQIHIFLNLLLYDWSPDESIAEL
jgi:hypothetical protein